MLHKERAFWDLNTANSVDDALDYLMRERVDLVVCDFNMPGKNGLDLISAIRSCDVLADIPVVMLTGNAESDLKRRALDCGAVDLLSKPVHREDLVARIRSVLQIRSYQETLRSMNADLEQRVAEKTHELECSRNELIWRLSYAVETRDDNTGAHIARVASLTKVIAEQLGLERAVVDRLFAASPLHDIGKIAIPDVILQKPGALTEQERRVIESHCRTGWEILMRPFGFGADDPPGNPLLKCAAEIALTHHEKWDGSGYPAGLKGEDIPISGRIVAVSDVLDALCDERPYKPRISFDESFRIVSEMSGVHFDPSIIDACQHCKEELRSAINPNQIKPVEPQSTLRSAS
jgi:putative two-component system response regulator